MRAWRPTGDITRSARRGTLTRRVGARRVTAFVDAAECVDSTGAQDEEMILSADGGVRCLETELHALQ